MKRKEEEKKKKKEETIGQKYNVRIGYAIQKQRTTHSRIVNIVVHLLQVLQ